MSNVYTGEEARPRNWIRPKSGEGAGGGYQNLDITKQRTKTDHPRCVVGRRATDRSIP